MPVSSLEMCMCSGCGFSDSRSLCYKSSFWFSIFIGCANRGRQKLPACLPLPAVPGLGGSCGIPGLCAGGTAPAHSSRAPGTWEPRGTQTTHLYRSWRNCPVLVLPGTGWLGRTNAGTPQPPTHFLPILFLSRCFRSGFCCRTVKSWAFPSSRNVWNQPGAWEWQSLGRPNRGRDEPPTTWLYMGASLSYASLPRRQAEDGQMLLQGLRAPPNICVSNTLLASSNVFGNIQRIRGF